MKETGLVVKLKDGIAVVKLERDIPADCCNKTSKKAAYFVEARNLCNAEIDNRVSVDMASAPGPSMRMLRIGLCAIGFIAGLILGEAASTLSGLSSYRELCSLGFALVLALGVCAGFRCVARRGKNSGPVVSGILWR
jgi:hypothetical protein